jgi:hypothetical protein
MTGPPEKEVGAPLRAPSQTETSHHNYDTGDGCQTQVPAESDKTTPVWGQSAVLTRPNDQIHYVLPLKLTLRHSDHELKQAWRDKTHAVYRHFGSRGQFIGWEASLIKVAPARRIFGKDYPEREVYPSNEDFGRYALSVGAQYDLEYAIEKAKTLKVQQMSPGGPAKTNWNGYGDVLEQKQTQTETKLKLKQNEIVSSIR